MPEFGTVLTLMIKSNQITTHECENATLVSEHLDSDAVAEVVLADSAIVLNECLATERLDSDAVDSCLASLSSKTEFFYPAPDHSDSCTNSTLACPEANACLNLQQIISQEEVTPSEKEAEKALYSAEIRAFNSGLQEEILCGKPSRVSAYKEIPSHVASIVRRRVEEETRRLDTIRIQGCTSDVRAKVTSWDLVMPTSGMYLYIPADVPLLRSVKEIAINLEQDFKKLELAYEGRTMDLRKSLRENGVTIPQQRSNRNPRPVELCLSVTEPTESKHVRNAIENYNSLLRIIQVWRSSLRRDDPWDFVIENCKAFKRDFNKQIIKLAAAVNCSMESLLESEDLLIETKKGERLTTAQFIGAGVAIAEHYPIRVRYHLQRPEGQRVRADQYKRCAIETCMNRIAGSEHFEVVSVFENRNDILLSRYVEFKEHLKQSLGSYFNQTSMRLHPCPETACLKGDLFDPLDSSVNEHRFFHGTSMLSAASIAGSSFSLNRSQEGSFGPGIYFADDPRKADHHARRSKQEMLFVMLLCRVACGRVKKAETRGNYRDDVLSPGASVDSIYGAPSQTTYSFNEYIIFKEMQCYPEFLIIYKRKG
jgi:hypothetical protein